MTSARRGLADGETRAWRSAAQPVAASNSGNAVSMHSAYAAQPSAGEGQGRDSRRSSVAFVPLLVAPTPTAASAAPSTWRAPAADLQAA
jgi:hypothetical protein